MSELTVVGVSVAWDDLSDFAKILRDWIAEGFETEGPRVRLANRLLDVVEKHADPRDEK